jgi:hypothetical protein
MTATLTAARTTDASTPSLVRTGLTAGAVAAAATTALAAAALAGDVPLEIEAEQIPLLGFAQMTALGAVLGVVLAKVLRRRAAHPRSIFVRTAVALTALSCVPSIAMPDTTASVVTLVLTHVVAAAIVVPALAGRLAE